MTDDWLAVKLLYIGAFITGLIGIGAGISPLRGNRECMQCAGAGRVY